MALEPDDLANGMEKITDEVFKHCEHGAQKNGLNNNALACGQFYGDSVKSRGQRGIHGTAAAISILLASDKKKHVDVAKRLLIYAKDHCTIDPHTVDDDLNTSKQAEILAALNDSADAPDYLLNLKTKLLNKKNPSDGFWGYFLDEDDKPSEVATCYAVLALNNRVPADQLLTSKKFLWKGQRDLEEQSKASDIYAIAIRSLILYVLATCKPDTAAYSQKDLKLAIKNLWNICRPHYKSAFEVPVEYERKEKNQYLRLPWQIYLAHALLLTDPTCFYTKRFQEYLSTLNQSAQSGGYYEHAGKYFSTRANAILFKFFACASKLTPHKTLYIRFIDPSLESWVQKKWVRLSAVGTLGVLGLLLSNYCKEQLNAQSPVWVEVIGWGFSATLTWLYSTGRR